MFTFLHLPIHNYPIALRDHSLIIGRGGGRLQNGRGGGQVNFTPKYEMLEMYSACWGGGGGGGEQKRLISLG